MTAAQKAARRDLERLGGAVRPPAPGDGSGRGGAWFGPPAKRPVPKLSGREKVILAEMAAQEAIMLDRLAALDRLRAANDARDRRLAAAQAKRDAVAEKFTKQARVHAFVQRVSL